jgi:hypothetical protein
MKEVGDDYFLTLVSRSLFKRSKSNKHDGYVTPHDIASGEHDEYVMHDLVSDLAKFISKEFTSCHEDDYSREILSKPRHFSYSSETFDTKKLETCMRLRTIIDLNHLYISAFKFGIQFLLLIKRCLRVLILSHGEISELSDSIGKFKQLRYLSLSCTWIRRLPDSICKLCNLQISDGSHCRYLAALPRDMYKLTNLRHLDIAETKIMEM